MNHNGWDFDFSKTRAEVIVEVIVEVDVGLDDGDDGGVGALTHLLKRSA